MVGEAASREEQGRRNGGGRTIRQGRRNGRETRQEGENRGLLGWGGGIGGEREQAGVGRLRATQKTVQLWKCGTVRK